MREVVLRRYLGDAKRLAVAAEGVSDLALGQLDVAARSHAVGLLDAVADHPELRAAIHQALDCEHPCAEGSGELRLTALRNGVGRTSRRLVDHRRFIPLLAILVTVLFTQVFVFFATSSPV